MSTKQALSAVAVAVGIAVCAAPSAAAAKGHPHAPVVEELASFAAPGCIGGCGSGSTIGPDGALYVTDGKAGRVLRIDPRSGAITTFATGLPRSTPLGIGGAIDIAFVGHTAYVLATLAGPGSVVRDLPHRTQRHRFADRRHRQVVGRPSTGDPLLRREQRPVRARAVPGGLRGHRRHLNRVLRVGRDGSISEIVAFGNVAPTGLAALGPALFIGQAGPVPHRPDDGKVLVRTPWSSGAHEVASGAPLIVDVELGPGPGLYALSQGVWDLPNAPENAGKPASPNTGSSRPGRPSRHLHAGRRRSRSPDLGGVHPRRRVRGHAHRQGPEDRRRRTPPPAPAALRRAQVGRRSRTSPGQGCPGEGSGPWHP